MTSQRRAVSGNRKQSCAYHANFVAELIPSRKASVQHGEVNEQNVVARITSKRNARHRLKKSTASETNPLMTATPEMNILMTAMWSTLQALLHYRKQYTPSHKQVILQ